jgi:uncharacterized protein (TIGR03435 family)
MGRTILALALFHVARALGQTPATPPAFEVAAVKVSHEPPGSTASKSTPGSLWMRGMTLRACIAMAYGVKELQVVGGPKWLDSERYDIDAKASSPAKGTELWVMLQTLLAGRFQVALHRETRISSGCVLLSVKAGVKMHAAEPGKLGMSSHNGHMIAEKASMADLAKDLSRRWGVEVEDATGLTSVYDFQLDLPERDRNNAAPSADSSDASDPASYATALSHALEDQLGLKLQERKVPLEVLVVDHAEKPMEN